MIRRRTLYERAATGRRENELEHKIAREHNADLGALKVNQPERAVTDANN